ncbi:SIR2-like domain-containing protein [Gracilibacillus orientalis]|uniref:NAD(+) hydrolase ThsA n=1 Tax=Gracilibacillus orientalis TaxID=334253 RepID=A0A1I4K4D8_9BACI|nr:SIR2 family protein [Gracilibacillus orientalis]SFL73660.1 SIR2-like domain-containing protein [Gracilibacillus orientalis]
MEYNPSIQEFLRTYVKAIQDSNAAIFAGAGLSRPAGYVDWKELLREVAQDLQLDIDQESDLIALAQYHVNEFSGRGKINQILIEEFTRSVSTSHNHKILSHLPISTYWTTNYDQLIETNLEAVGKKVDKKITSETMTYSVPGSDVTVYKMHGDSTLPHDAVLTKDDYEGYDQKRQIYSTALRGDLVSKTFLFIGFSFDDPNLSQILSRIRILLNENKRTHYCFMKKVKANDFNGNDDEFRYAEIKQNLKIKDLMRYGIKVLLIDDYPEITEILQHIASLIIRKNIFVSGSASDYGDWGEEKSFEFSTSLSKALIKNNNNIVSGFGLGIGSCIISGALEELYSSQNNKVEQRLKCRPFPQNTTGGLSIKDLWTKYRNDMISNIGISVFIFGNKIDTETKDVIDANGMVEEFDISIEKGAIPIPVGATGFTSKILWQRVMDDFGPLVGIEDLKPLYSDLGDESKNSEELIETVVKIINLLAKH